MSKKLITGLACIGVIIGLAGFGPARPPHYYLTVVDAKSTGTDTGMAFVVGQRISVKSSGYVTLDKSSQPQPRCDPGTKVACWNTPAGHGKMENSKDPNCLAGSLIGTIAGSGVYHCLGGQSGSFDADAAGDLILLTNASDYNNNLDDFEVLVQTL